MRRLFIVLAKLIGLLQVYWALTYLAHLALFLGQMSRMEPTEAGQTAIQVAGIVAFTVLAFGVAWLLLVRTEKLADLLKIPTDDPLPMLSDDVVLRAGMKLTGVYMVANSIPGLVSAICEVGAYGTYLGPFAPILTKVLPAALRLALGLLLAIRTGFVMDRLATGEKVSGKRIVIGGLVLLVLFLLLARGLNNHPWLRPRTRYSSEVVHRSYADQDPVIIEKDTNTPAARDWYTVPRKDDGLLTNNLSDFSNASIVQVVEFLKETP